MAQSAFVSGSIAVRKSDICIPESSIRTKSVGVMPCRWAIPNTSAMARSTTSRLGCAGCPILFISPLYKRSAFWRKKNGRMSDVPAQDISEAPNAASNCGRSGCANWRAQSFAGYCRLPTFCRNARAPVWSKLHTVARSSP
jgi:hypothetical protein